MDSFDTGTFNTTSCPSAPFEEWKFCSPCSPGAELAHGEAQGKLVIQSLKNTFTSNCTGKM